MLLLVRERFRRVVTPSERRIFFRSSPPPRSLSGNIYKPSRPSPPRLRFISSITSSHRTVLADAVFLRGPRRACPVLRGVQYRYRRRWRIFKVSRGERFRKIMCNLKAAKLLTLFLNYCPIWSLGKRVQTPSLSVNWSTSYVNTGMERGPYVRCVRRNGNGGPTNSIGVFRIGHRGDSKALRTLPLRPNHARVCEIHV